MAHHLMHFSDDQLKAAYPDHSSGYSQAPLIDHTIGSVHTGTHICQLEAGGVLHPHQHAFEESFYVLSGEGVLLLEGQAYQLRRGDICAVKVGQMHGLRATGPQPLRWFQMAAPQPKPPGTGWEDTFFSGSAADVPTTGSPITAGMAGGLFNHFAVEDIPPPGDPAREGAGAPPGVFLRWIMDEKIGAVHHRLLFIEYQPGVSLALHDHTFEESYLILSGRVDVHVDGASFTAGPGDVIWTGVGCFHSFANNYDEPVRWLETFAPQPPREDVFRFKAAWAEKAGK